MTALLAQNLPVVCQNCDILNGIGATTCYSCKQPTDRPGPASPAPPVLRPQAVPVARQPDVPSQVPLRPQVVHEPFGHSAPTMLAREDTTPSDMPGVSPTPPASVPWETPGWRGGGPRAFVTGGASRGQTFSLAPGESIIGRNRGPIRLANDPSTSSLHATITVDGNAVSIRDEASASGVYVTIRSSERIAAGTLFCAGNRCFRYAGMVPRQVEWNRFDVMVHGAPLPPDGSVHVVEEILIGGRPGRSVATTAPKITIGQANADFAFPNEEGLWGIHCELSFANDAAKLTDLSGGLGTFVRIRDQRALANGDRVRIGNNILRIEV